jgi:hypothetical protein
MTFALLTMCSGAGVSSTASDPSKRSTQVRYLHHDHLHCTLSFVYPPWL